MIFYHQYYFVPNDYNPANAVVINTAPNVPGQAPTQGSIIPGVGDPYNGMVREGTNGLPKGGQAFPLLILWTTDRICL